MKNIVYVCHNENAKYPSSIDYFSPSCAYPEYPFNVLAKENNYVYEMVRNSLVGLGFDLKNYGTDSWNPFGDFICKGNTVLIKPNMVNHMNPVDGLECLVTNPSVLRAIIDYVLIALKGTGKIIIGDAPVQGCDFKTLCSSGEFDKLTEFYASHGIDIEFHDFRGTSASINTDGILVQEKNEIALKNAVIVDLGDKSAFIDKTNKDKLRITNYAAKDLLAHHNFQRNEYCIVKNALEADVIINVPKPKTHRKAGITGALKNMIGITVEKEYLPHHTQGSVDTGGDEYEKKNLLKQFRSLLIDKREDATKLSQYQKARFLNVLALGMSIIIRLLSGNKNDISEGNWFGNDTIWRTVSDLNTIVRYADVNGNLSDEKKRIVFTIADMIVAGEGDGPLSPSSNQLDIIMAGFDAVEIDKVITTLMGIDYTKIPCVYRASLMQNFNDRQEVIISSNGDFLQEHALVELDYNKFRHVVMPHGWESV